MSEKSFVARTQVVQPRFSVWCPEETVLRTLTVAHGPDLTLLAIARQSLQFGQSECPLRRTLKQLNQRSLFYVPEMMFIIDEMVA